MVLQIHKGKSRAAICCAVMIACACILTATHAQKAFAYSQGQQYVRIGLNYGAGTSANATAQSYQVYSKDGISAGFVNTSGEYTSLYDFKLISQTDVMNLSGYAFGKRYAVVTGRDTGSLADMAWRSEDMLHRGYDPQLAYFGGWVLITGFYDSKDAALQAVQTEFAVAFPKWDFRAEELMSQYILIAIKSQRQFIFDTDAGNLRVGSIQGAKRDNPYLIELNGKPYRGEIELVGGAGAGVGAGTGANTGITAVNVLKMNEYLYGVVPRELEASSPPEALKAQAVAARTYAVSNMGKHGASGFDLCCTAHCQVYAGYAAEDARALQAVDKTGDELVRYNEAPIEAFYFSSSGGRTENVENVWSSNKEYPYLVSVEDNYESGKSLHYYWHTVYSAKDIESKLASGGVDIGNVTEVAVTKTSEGGRVIELVITGTTGKKVYTKESCRLFMDNIYSQRYSVFAAGQSGKTYTAVGVKGTCTLAPGGAETVGDGDKAVTLIGGGGTVISGAGLSALPARGEIFHFVGSGWGHGVGMSQEGAKGMALAGFSYKEILTHYFTGCTIK